MVVVATAALSYWQTECLPALVVDVAHQVVKIEAVGYKQGNTLFVHGEEYVL